MSSTEKFLMEKTVPVDPHACVKKLEMDPDTLGLSSAQEELDALMLEQAMLEELVEQQKLELELSHTMEKMALIENPDPVEEVRSYINRTVPASSACAPSHLTMYIYKDCTLFLVSFIR